MSRDNYMSSEPQDVTYLEELPDLESLDVMKQNPHSSESINKKYIRNQVHMSQLHPQSGMTYSIPSTYYNDEQTGIPYSGHHAGHHAGQHAGQHAGHHAGQHAGQHAGHIGGYPYNSTIHQTQMLPEYTVSANGDPQPKLCGNPTCVDVANHIEHCPVCSQIYKKDETVYYVIMAIQFIIIVILLKKVLDV